ncbi:MAG TPA: NIPSNAP family protein [Burkholderiaceae bacterium]|nr:NIPSNAP family protein [Burkholderiaceae bacterium]
MIHELTTLEIKVASNAKVYAALQERLPSAGGTLVGAFASDIGDLSRVMLLRAFTDANAASEAQQRLLMDRNPLGCGEWLASLQSERFALFPFLAAPQPGAYGKWYELRTYSLRHGALAETIEAWKAALPARHAMSPCLGVFTALDGEQPRFLNIWAYDSVDARARIRGDAVAQGLWPPQGGPANLTKMQSNLCIPLPFSPMR